MHHGNFRTKKLGAPAATPATAGDMSIHCGGDGIYAKLLPNAQIVTAPTGSNSR